MGKGHQICRDQGQLVAKGCFGLGLGRLTTAHSVLALKPMQRSWREQLLQLDLPRG